MPSSGFFRSLFLVGLALLLPSLGYAEPASETTPPIQDNSFLIEEAYNQEFGVVQHTSTLTRLWNRKDWIYTFTQEWPAPGDPRHQLSYTLAWQHAGAFPNSGSGMGDLLLNYRFQLIGNGETRVAFAPRATLIFSTGNAAAGRTLGGTGVQTNLPLSIVVAPKFVTHWNAGATFVPHATNAFGAHASSSGYNLGQSFVWLAKSRFNLLLETAYTNSQTVVGREKTQWTPCLYVSPGIRWAYNLKNGLQVIPGIGVPVGIGPSRGESGIFLYLSFEHPFRTLPPR